MRGTNVTHAMGSATGDRGDGGVAPFVGWGPLAPVRGFFAGGADTRPPSRTFVHFRAVPTGVTRTPPRALGALYVGRG